MVEWWYQVFLMIDFGSYGSEVIISRGCVKFHPVAFKKIQDGRQNSTKSLLSPYFLINY